MSALDDLRRFFGDPEGSWRSGTPASQAAATSMLILCVLACSMITGTNYNLMPLTAYFVWLTLGALLLRFRGLLVLAVITVAGVAFGFIASQTPLNLSRSVALVAFAIAILLILFNASRQRSGLPGLVSDATLADLRDRLQAQGRVPPLPEGWRSQSASIAAHGVGYGGDFMVVYLSEDERFLEMTLVDVCGKGVGAAVEALQFAGALGGLVGVMPPDGLIAGANSFLYRQESSETFATAVHVLADLVTGEYRVTSAGHPPVLVWSATRRAWTTDGARGTALGVVKYPETEVSHGRLGPGEGLLFYTDGVVESRTADLDEGVMWLKDIARDAVVSGFSGAPRRIIRKVARGDDDRAVLMLWREPA